jgi:basic amino acid/polyamine antiporter, APA family
LQTLLTCDYLAILPHSDFNIITEKQNLGESEITKGNKKNMVVLYDDGDNSDEILKVTKWFANTERFNLNVVSINRKANGNHKNVLDKSTLTSTNKNNSEYIKRREHFLQSSEVELNEIYISEEIEKDSLQFAKTILKSIVAYNPDIVITESTIGKYNLFTNSSFANLLMYRINCPIIIVKDFSLPLVNTVTHILKKIIGHVGISYLLNAIQNKTK